MSQETLGWEEWASFPKLGIPAIIAKIDTGARTSALHAFAIEPFGSDANPFVRFGIHPVPDRPDIEIFCSAKMVDRREVTSSNGEKELRYVIETPVQIGDTIWPIEVTLTNRENLQYRMLLGRTAIKEEMIVDPNQSFLQPALAYDLYKHLKKSKPVERPLRLGLLTREPENYSSRKIIQAAEDKGHVCEIVNPTRCYMNINALSPEVHYSGDTLPQYDAIIPRIGASITEYGMAVVRQFNLMGAFCLNEAAAIGASRDKLYAHQVLAQHRIDMPITAFAKSTQQTSELIDIVGGAPLVVKLLESTQGKGVVLAETKKAAESVIGAFRGLQANFLVQEFIKEAAGTDIRCLVIGGKVVASMMRQAEEGEFRSNLHRGGEALPVKISKAERAVAVKAAKAIGLNVAGVDLLRSDSGPKVLEINSSPGLQGVERATGINVAVQMINYIEKNVRPRYRNKRTTKTQSK
ncbi:MAG: 30S ribosomal protein S6--L-glutamate ligase [Rhodospirillaceae bacterium]|jgi:ribosomal protein S6--L-glutamate ligase|nr:30S ribosomal protein S6--L-glutamate ligase [Rhodospirillaceae bacterium]MBT4937785.1 30S ribosomal protein S6--L-glutamate ligase [Rhodospirillaceae bacterium]MBT7268223.1 30S ribosomal protein S6--L-glutamate ligase [Rhodospirillaceae bacterium]